MTVLEKASCHNCWQEFLDYKTAKQQLLPREALCHWRRKKGLDGDKAAIGLIHAMNRKFYGTAVPKDREPGAEGKGMEEGTGGKVWILKKIWGKFPSWRGGSWDLPGMIS